MKNDFESEYRIYTEIRQQYQDAKDKDEMDEARARLHSLIESVEAKGDDYTRAFKYYRDSKDCENDYIDINDGISDKQVPGLIKSFRDNGIEYFTFSDTYSKAINTSWLFIENGCILEDLIQINGEWDALDGEFVKKPAYLFRVH